MGRKQPRSKTIPIPERVPKTPWLPAPAKVPSTAVSVRDFYRLHPAWRVGQMEVAQQPFGWHSLDRAKAHEIRAHLANLESMTWSEILVSAKKQNHLIPVIDLTTSAQRRIEQRRIAVDELVSRRLSARERIFGYLEDGVCVVLFWDPRHEICPAGKRNT